VEVGKTSDQTGGTTDTEKDADTGARARVIIRVIVIVVIIRVVVVIIRVIVAQVHGGIVLLGSKVGGTGFFLGGEPVGIAAVIIVGIIIGIVGIAITIPEELLFLSGKVLTGSGLLSSFLGSFLGLFGSSLSLSGSFLGSSLGLSLGSHLSLESDFLVWDSLLVNILSRKVGGTGFLLGSPPVGIAAVIIGIIGAQVHGLVFFLGSKVGDVSLVHLGLELLMKVHKMILSGTESGKTSLEVLLLHGGSDRLKNY